MSLSISNNIKATCSICFEEVDQKAKTLPCNHKFHKKCVDKWLKKHNDCPNCRKVADERLDSLAKLWERITNNELSLEETVATVIEGFQLEEAGFNPHRRITRSWSAALKGVNNMKHWLEEQRK